MKKYRFGASWQGLLVFVLVSIPYFTGMFSPRELDLVRLYQAPYPLLSWISYVFQGLMGILLFFFVRKQPRTCGTARIFLIPLTILLAGYYLIWICYYAGSNSLLLFLGMSVVPALIFLLYEIWKQNYPAMIPTVLFAAIHFFITCANY